MLREALAGVLVLVAALTTLTGARHRSVGPADVRGGHWPIRVLGDPATADRVAVLVPGVGVDPAHLDAPDQVLGMAHALAAAAHRTAPDVRLAVVAWADYPAPDGVGLAAVRGLRADVGARRLSAYLDRLGRRAPVTLLCHSYGSVVCGLTRLDRQVSDVVLYGSPGVRLDSAAGFGRGVRVWAARDTTDWIRFVPNIRLGDLGHGRDPMSPVFGARIVSARGATGHGGYYARGTESLANFARIATGRYGAVRCAGFCSQMRVSRHARSARVRHYWGE